MFISGVFHDSVMAMTDLTDPSPHSGQGSSLVACSALTTGPLETSTEQFICGMSPPKMSGRSIMTFTGW